MNTFRTKELLQELEAITATNLKVIEDHATVLSSEQLNWKKDHSSWSILEILAHLNEYALYYNEVISRRIDKTRFREPRQTFISSPLGRSAWISMKLGNARNVKRKLRSPRIYNPSFNKEILLDNSASTFLESQKELLNIIRKAANVSLRKVRIPISISKLIRLRLGDALMFVIYHNERHIQQVLNNISNKNFPKNSSEAWTSRIV